MTPMTKRMIPNRTSLVTPKKKIRKPLNSSWMISNSNSVTLYSRSFASSGLCPTTENPGIWIPNVGIIGLPIQGPDTIVDLTFRNTQELNADELELRNHKWDTALA